LTSEPTKKAGDGSYIIKPQGGPDCGISTWSRDWFQIQSKCLPYHCITTQLKSKLLS